MIIKLNTMKKQDFEYHEYFYVKTFLQLISIPGCDNKSWTISVHPPEDATINGVQLNNEIKFQK